MSGRCPPGGGPGMIFVSRAFEAPWECESLSTMTEMLHDAAPQGVKTSTDERRQVMRHLGQDRFSGFSPSP